MPPYDHITDAAAGKSSSWPGGEPQSVRDAADAKQAGQDGKFTALRRALRRIGESITGRADHEHAYRTDFWGDVARWCGELAPEGAIPS